MLTCLVYVLAGFFDDYIYVIEDCMSFGKWAPEKHFKYCSTIGYLLQVVVLSCLLLHLFGDIIKFDYYFSIFLKPPPLIRPSQGKMFCIASMKTLTVIGTPTIWVNDDVRSPVTSGSGWFCCLQVIYNSYQSSPFCVSVPDLLFKPQLLI